MGSWARGQTDPGPLPQLPPAPFLEHHLFPVFIPVTSIPRSASSCLSATSEHSGVLIQLPLLSSWPAPLPSPPPGRPHSLRDPVGVLHCPPPHSLLLTAPAPRAHAGTPQSAEAAHGSVSVSASSNAGQCHATQRGRAGGSGKGPCGCSWRPPAAEHGLPGHGTVSQRVPRHGPPRRPSAARLSIPPRCRDRGSEGLEQPGRTQARSASCLGTARRLGRVCKTRQPNGSREKVLVFSSCPKTMLRIQRWAMTPHKWFGRSPGSPCPGHHHGARRPPRCAVCAVTTCRPAGLLSRAPTPRGTCPVDQRVSSAQHTGRSVAASRSGFAEWIMGGTNGDCSHP